MSDLSSRQERRKQRVRQKLLDAARRLIAERGFEEITVLDITEAADVSKGTFYQYFTDKEDLTRTLIMNGYEMVRSRINETMLGKTGLEAAHEALQLVFQDAADNRDLFRIMLGKRVSSELNLFAFDYFVGMIESIILHKGVIGKPHPYIQPELLAQFIAGACLQVAIWWLDNDHGLSSDAISEIMFKLLFEGVPPPPDKD